MRLVSFYVEQWMMESTDSLSVREYQRASKDSGEGGRGKSCSHVILYRESNGTSMLGTKSRQPSSSAEYYVLFSSRTI